MPTTNPVPSTDPSDLLFNAGKLDEVVNGTANSFTDRLGVARRTVAGMNADFDAQLADAESDLNVYRADAAASAAEALGYLQTIRATSYGAYASDPATDPLGNPPTVGDEYFNTTANLLKRWNGTTWQASDINTANLAASSGSSLVGYMPAGTGAVATTVQEVLRETVSVFNFMTAAQIADVRAGTALIDVTSAIQLAVDSFVGNTGVVHLPPGTYKITSSIVLPYQVSLSGSYRASKIQTVGDIAAISWSASSVSIAKNIAIENIELVGSGKTSVYTNNHGILFNHPFGIEQLSLKNVYIRNFGGYGAKCAAPVSDSWIVWQYAHWDTVFITECAYGTQLGNGFVGESLFSNCAITEITNTAVEFTTQPPSTTPAQGITLDSCYFGRGKKHLDFIAQCAGVVTFNSCHFEGASECIAKISATTAPFVNFNDCWYIFNVAGTNILGINYTSVDVGYINIRGGRFWVYGAATGNVASFVKVNGNAYVVVSGAVKVTGSATKHIDATAAPNTVSGNVEIVSATEANFSVFVAQRFNNTIGIGAFPSTSGKGITFPAVQSPSSNVNTLDDYEEGTFTPVLTCASPGNLAVAYSSQLGWYQKIGNRVTVHVDVITSSFTHTTAAGGVFIDGHPFVVDAVGYNAISEIQGVTKAGYTQFGVLSSGILRGSGSGQPVASLQISDFPTGGSVRVRYSMTYIATA